MAEGFGAHLLSQPELVSDMVHSAFSSSGLPVSIKIRIHKDIKYVPCHVDGHSVHHFAVH